MKQVRKAVRTFLINDNKVIVIKYKTNKNMSYYDIPGGKSKKMKVLLMHQLENLKKKLE